MSNYTQYFTRTLHVISLMLVHDIKSGGCDSWCDFMRHRTGQIARSTAHGFSSVELRTRRDSWRHVA